MANPVFDAVRTVLAVREFDDRVVPSDYARRKIGIGRTKRKPLGEVVSDENFGTPWKG
jgi:hypothetical protein